MEKITSYRQYEVLAALRDNKAGLTTSQVLKACRDKAGSELPNDSTVVSKLIFSMRSVSPKPITSMDISGGKLHKITPHGIELLEAYEKENAIDATEQNPASADPDRQPPNADDVPTAEAPQLEPDQPAATDASPAPIDDAPIETSALRENAVETLARDGYIVLDPYSQTEQFICEVVQALKQARQRPTLANKSEKVQLLKFMQSFHGKLNEDVDKVLGDIIDDLEAMEAE